MSQASLAIAPATSIAQVISSMEAIAASLPESNGIACFNRMYLEVTQLVDEKVHGQFFADPDFITALDITFANLYFAAVNAFHQQQAVPLAWRPLTEHCATGGIEPIQFALAGMNAHINHDLPLAVAQTCAAMGSPPDTADHHADYQKVDGLLDAEDEAIRQSFEDSAQRSADRHLSAVANLIGNWCINDARDVAWTNALLLWELRDQALARSLFLDGLSAAVALSSRTLLVAV